MIQVCSTNLFCYKYEDCINKPENYCCIHHNQKIRNEEMDKKEIDPCIHCNNQVGK